jgi:hypothetical protein
MEDIIIIEKRKPEEIPTPGKRGVVILALGHPYYGCYAFNLAMSIKFSDPQMPVAIAYNESGIRHIDPERRAIIDLFLKVDESYFTHNGVINYIRAKLFLDKISPFEETIVLDADMIWLPQRSISGLFDKVATSQIAIANKGWMKLNEAKEGFIQWANPADILKAYPELGESKLHNLFSEMIYFKKGEASKSLFEEARKVPDNPGFNFRRFAGGMPDELALEIAMLKNKTELAYSPLCPFYWEVFEKKNLAHSIMYQQFYAYSMGGAFLADPVIKFYDNLAKFYTNQFKLSFHFPARKKNTFLPERASI